MNIKRLIEIVHDSFPRNERITKKQVSTILERLLDTISDEIIKENTVNLYGFGSFTIGYRPARLGINPQTLEPLQLPASKSIKFKASTRTKESLNKKN